MMTQSITTRFWDDFHRHLREGELMWNLMQHLAPVIRMTVMPNLNPPVLNAAHAEFYQGQLVGGLINAGWSTEMIARFQFLMTIYLTRDTTPDMIREAAASGVVVAGKAYPHNGTTNSEFGLDYEDYFRLAPVYEAMAEAGMLLLIHGESPTVSDHFYREEAFLPILKFISQQHPQLKIVLEHVSTASAVNAVLELPNVAATITGHHLMLTYQDVYGPGDAFNPHHKCMPIAKSQKDLERLVWAATSGNPKFFLGSDCAAHPREKKEGVPPEAAAAGVFTGPVLASVVIEVFEQHGALDMLGDFVSGFGADWYGLERNQGEVTFVKEPWVVPDQYDGVVPFRAGQTLQWQMQRSA